MIKMCQKGLWLAEYTVAIMKMLEDVSFYHLEQCWRLVQLVIPQKGSKEAPYFIITRQNHEHQEIAIDGADIIENHSGLREKLRSPGPSKGRPSWEIGRTRTFSVENPNTNRIMRRESGKHYRLDRHRRSHTQVNNDDPFMLSIRLSKQHTSSANTVRSSSLPTYLQPKAVPFRGSVITRGKVPAMEPDKKQADNKSTFKDYREHTNDQQLFGRNKRRSSFGRK